ncbi:uncharacterized protein N7484_007797 [Penicillium longicatenatum]|uniref:uncharacterized protein n=1 Tax=Penicillium longicatenatum TaxID=1561947 RepID=UPI0025475EC1|nr:uncharacterized protein N7484_007797 [Penicillium longicatenatum]KAJ5639935.1 hypothetical protein N7484_007797 [Penicillium longicatenatum]
MAILSPAKGVSLLTFPAELLVVVFGCSSSFKDVANLAASCKRLNRIWKEHTSYICNLVASTTTPCYEDLRALLAKQGYLALDAQVLEISDVARIIQTSQNVNDLATSFLDRVKKHRHWDPQVPKVLSPLEEIRFIRAHYQIWGLMRLGVPEQKECIGSMDLEQSCLLSDFLCIFDPWGIKDPVLEQIMDRDPAAHHWLQQKIRRQRNKGFLEQLNHAYKPMSFTPYEKHGRYAWWCDRQQDVFKKMLTGFFFKEEQDSNTGEEEEESSGEENY